MSKHTPEPWTGPFYRSDVGPDDEYFIDYWGVDGVGKFDNEVDAQRAMACVNACAGINPEAVPDVVEALRILLRYEGIVVEYMGGMGNMDSERNTQQQFTAARAALAKLEDVV